VWWVRGVGAEVDEMDQQGNTALHAAARFGHELLVSTLLHRGADPTKYVQLYNCLCCGRFGLKPKNSNEIEKTQPTYTKKV